MGFLGVCRAIYDYAPQAEGELAIIEGDLLYVLDKQGDDGWWKAKKKAGEDDDDEPTGLVPINYVEEAPSLSRARALYDYTRQTDEELSFSEDAQLAVLDTSDPDWILVGLDGEFGFVPANYIEVDGGADEAPAPPLPPAPPQLPARPQPEPVQPDSPVEPASPPANPAAALAGVLHARQASQQASPPPQPTRNTVTFQEPPESDDEPIRSPALPSRPPRPPSPPSPVYNAPSSPVIQTPRDNTRTPGGFHLYNINEMISIMGKKKKMPTTLGINLLIGTILIAPEHASDGPSQEWTADRMTHYSREGKHVFMELVRPSKSVDFHAGAKDTAEEIVSALGELAGAVRAEGLREVIMAGSGSGSGSGSGGSQRRKKGIILYDFMAQGEDEVTVAINDEVIILDDTKSEEWWQVRRLKNGKEGVVPSSYIEITGSVSPPSGAASGHSSAKSMVEQNRLEEIRLTKEAIRASKEPQQVGPGMPLPQRGSSLMAIENGSNSGQQRSRRENGRGDGNGKPKSKPDSSKVRTWADRSRSFSVEAQFLGLKDGKLHLHKMNGVKIAVPISKMSREDLEYVENLTGISLDDEKPLADVKRARSAEKKAPEATAGVTIQKKSDYDWFQFFLSCEVAVGLCERYAQAFIKDSMDESVLSDVDASTLRALGLREGDIIKVMRALDVKYARNRGGKQNASSSGDGDGAAGGLFSGPGGTLRNNTRKGRPAPAVQTSDIVDAKAFSKPDSSEASQETAKSPTAVSPIKSTPETSQKASSGFDDDAWDVKPTKQQPPPETKPKSPEPQLAAPPPTTQALTGSMQELSLLTEPLQPSKVEAPAPPKVEPIPEPPAPAQPLPGASPAFFTGGPLVPPPPQRPLSAPQSAQPSAFSPPPLVAQMTGSLQGQVAPVGQSLTEINQARLQQQYTAQMQQQQQPLQPTMTGYPGPQGPGMVPYQTGAPAQFMQSMMTGAPGSTQFAPLQTQPSGFQPSFATQPMYGQQPATGNINSYLPPPLEPQRTGLPPIQPQVTGFGGINGPMAPMPLQPQQTGPAPSIRFGMTAETKKLAPQATGRRANLAQATPDNPFGF
ncbi:hypothetical protein B0T10DRAFT_477036 [Thelonectria olida]|uniref:Actin cytoskeleton-regulatory complex protein SLA1 n=1 Tax=Thelonectria olida TaxID=1576542 RepID=A0A9P8W9N0_9HYPO|nr:hypothetical protein B0T10DRAFT_477036 [Thelonectria olida]